ncbi:DUF4845 domain-containing protein [Aurantivibrio plasticivorans]
MTFKMKSMNCLRSQRGLSSIAWLAIISAAGFIGLCAFKVGPQYFDNMYITSTLKDLPELIQDEGDVSKVSKDDISSFISNRFTINNIRNISKKEIDIKISKDKFIVDINYERRIPLFYNVDVVVAFKNQFDSSRPTECCTPLDDE